ncbi:hypothetical protein BDN72DRAFT_814143 [Pluteus cervinus]|uniref:Uncharacterized protein n=1 Tax=Pluteus cervinus TaxID=181527 RepID=A0ACD3B6Z8_9AGAR|nr:hypothetical protein BDN72DRAFT_814143 [Pluteus cervinus]
MPRRPSKGAKAKNKSQPRQISRADARIKKWDKRSDIPLDDEDQFHASRDRILLDGNVELSDDGDEEEVFALKGMDDSDSGNENDPMDEDEDDDESHVIASTSKVKSTPKSKKKKSALSSSSSSESEDEEETWGRGKNAYYADNADEIDSDDEEANELEEQEALRLQKKAREGMSDDDFGLNDVIEIQDTDDLVDPIAPAQVTPVTLPRDPKELVRHLEKTNPESIALARDWADTARSVAKAKLKLEQLQATQPDAVILGMVHLHYQTLLTYASTLAFYLYLRSSEKYVQRQDLLKSHPIMKRLLTLKRGLSTLEDLDFAFSDSEDDEDEDEGDIGASEDDDFVFGLKGPTGIDREEFEQLLREAGHENPDWVHPYLVQPPSPEKRPKKKRKTGTKEKTEAVSVFDLVEPDFEAFKSTSTRKPEISDVTDTYGEATSLQHADALDKKARKKSLRFHTSKIESSSARRQGARNNALGGDDDIPYRERKKDREDKAHQETKSRGQGGEDLNDEEPPSRLDQDDRMDEVVNSDDEYYELVKKQSKAKKEKKKVEYDAAREAQRRDLAEIEASDGPRALTRAIQANKGLTPHRPKSVRNPRVKKRQKFEKAKKKVSSQKAVYKGGLAESGHYGGESSGISKVVKSVRLG